MRQFLLACALVILLVGVSPANGSVHSSETTICDNLDEWLTVLLPPHIIDFLCSINDAGNPVTVRQDRDSPLEGEGLAYESAIEDSDLPEEARQQLLLLLALCSQR